MGLEQPSKRGFRRIEVLLDEMERFKRSQIWEKLARFRKFYNRVSPGRNSIFREGWEVQWIGMLRVRREGNRIISVSRVAASTVTCTTRRIWYRFDWLKCAMMLRLLYCFNWALLLGRRPSFQRPFSLWALPSYTPLRMVVVLAWVRSWYYQYSYLEPFHRYMPGYHVLRMRGSTC